MYLDSTIAHCDFLSCWLARERKGKCEGKEHTTEEQSTTRSRRTARTTAVRAKMEWALKPFITSLITHNEVNKSGISTGAGNQAAKSIRSAAVNSLKPFHFGQIISIKRFKSTLPELASGLREALLIRCV